MANCKELIIKSLINNGSLKINYLCFAMDKPFISPYSTAGKPLPYAPWNNEKTCISLHKFN
jgi:hypothetical protein